jgi:aminobenzoyl-glutamate utilization protein A
VTDPKKETVIARRRSFHQYPEPSWCEFYTTHKLVEHVREIGVDDLFVGADALDGTRRLGVPDDDLLEHWWQKAAEEGASKEVLKQTEGGLTGLVAVLDRGPGPVVGLRVDIDALPFTEAEDSEHEPAAAGFRSDNDGVMHACGHDAHMAIGLGVLEEYANRDFIGTLKVFFQPAEEVLGGGGAMANTAHVEDVDALFALHVGLGHPTGTVVAGSERQLSIRQLVATFKGESAHAGLAPNEGRNALSSMAAAIQNLHAISRHSDDITRVNVGRAEGGSASNVVADRATIELEARAGSNEVLTYLSDRIDRVLTSAAEMYECELSTTLVGQAPRVDSDEELREVVASVADSQPTVKETIRRAPFGASEDATYFMQRVIENGGTATHVIIGTDHPSGHHTPRFDIDEASISIGIEVIGKSIDRVFDSVAD